MLPYTLQIYLLYGIPQKNFYKILHYIPVDCSTMSLLHKINHDNDYDY